MTVKEFLASIDPDEKNWKTLSPGHWQNKVTGALYDTTDIVQAQIDANNAPGSGKPRFIPGITPVPEDISVVPGGRPGGGTGGFERPPAIGGGIVGDGRDNPRPIQHPGYIPGSEWNNPTGGGGGGAPPPGASGFGGSLQWKEPTSSGTGGPQRTGMAMPFSPYGIQQQLSSEILRYGGRPNSGAGGYWSGGEAAPMKEMFGKSAPSGKTSAGPMDPYDAYNSALADALRDGTSQQSRPDPNDSYQNVTISDRDGELWTDPKNGQTYVFGNGRWNKTDTTNRPGPVVAGPTGTKPPNTDRA